MCLPYPRTSTECAAAAPCGAALRTARAGRRRRFDPSGKFAALAAAAVLLWPLASTAGSHPESIAQACDSAEYARVLTPVKRAPGDARAYWLDRRLLRWPGVSGGARFRLYYSATAALRAESGGRVAGADGSALLQTADAVPVTLAERFSFIGDGIDLSVAEHDLPRIAQWLTGQLLLVREDAAGTVLDATGIQLPGALDDLYAAAADIDDLGVRIDGAQARFRLWAPTARAVSLCIHPEGSAPATAHLPMRRDAATGTWSTSTAADLRGSYYTYLVEVFVPGTGIVRNRVTDPYSISLTTDSRRSYIADLDDATLKPAGWEGAPRPREVPAQTDLSVYELHVRDFSIGDATVPEPDRGKYRAFTHEQSDGMRHLRALAQAGVTDVHLLPVFDFATVPETGCFTPAVPASPPDSPAQQDLVMAHAARDCFNWGYDPYHYSAPEGSYASDAADGAVRIREFRRMVMALHGAGLRVGMDVVYNHTTASGQHERSVLDRIVPGYYLRLDARGKVEQSTCCDNTATEHRMMAKLMIDSVALWARHYRIDSFRFDLMGHQPRDAMERLQRRVDAAAGRHIHLIGEGWNFGEIADGKRFVQASQLSLPGSGIGTFNDRMRDALRGGGCCDSGRTLVAAQGYLNGLHYAPNALADHPGKRDDLLAAADLVRAGLAGSLRDFSMQVADGRRVTLARIDYKGQPAGYAAQPGEVVNYVENHDNPTLFDINALKLPADSTREERARVQLLGAAFVALSQGVAYYHAGIDLLRSKSLDRNSFDSGDWFNRLDWSGQDNVFGQGLPPAADNGKDWELLRPFLADADAIRPAAQDIAWMRAAFRDLLRIRASSTLFRLRSAQDVQQRLRFHNTGPEQNPAVIAGHLDGEGYEGARFGEVLYLVNVSPDTQTLVLPEEADKRYVLHPVHRAGTAADRRPLSARYRARDGRVVVPARTAVVFVVE